MEELNVTILLVEDDPSMLDGIKDLLEMAPMETEDMRFHVSVNTAYDGFQGLAQAREHPPELIISDIMMPKMTGHEFLHEIRQNPDWFQIPFIFLTAKGEKSDYEEGRLKGADLYITKPFDSDAFLEQIKTQLHRSLKLKALQQQHIEDLKKHILQILYHEFRTPLTYVTAYYEMLEDGVDRPAEVVREYLRGIQAGCVRLTRLVEDFLLVISLLSGESLEKYQNYGRPIFELQQILQDAIRHPRNSSTQSSVQIELNVPLNLPLIWGNSSDIFNIFTRLIDNAIKFSDHRKENKTVIINVVPDSNELRVEIKDNGIGFPEYVQDQLHDLFFQYNRDAMEQQGAGTGLTIVKGLVELHQGRLELESREGEGSTFSVVFPIYTGNIDSVDDSLHKSDEAFTEATILAVEDDQNLLTGLEDLLETMGGIYKLEVLTATNGLEGLEVLKKRVPDLIISDIMMPQMTGFEFLQEIRKNLDWLHIPVIFLTARGEAADKNKAFISGVDEYITKPYDSDVLLKFVKSQLDRRFRLQRIIGNTFDDLKQSILSLVTPDFRQPLSFVSEYTEKLANDLEVVKTGAELRNSLQGIQIGSSWLKRVIEDLMSLAELKTGEARLAHNLHLQKIPNIGVLLSEFALLHERKLANEGVRVHFTKMDPSVKPIYGDISTISNSIRRLIEVGVRYAVGVNGEKDIYLSVAQQETKIRIVIQFPALLPDEIYLAVASLLASDVDNVAQQSIDLGPNLSIAKGYIDLHEGKITLDNDGDMGCRFIIALPLVTKQP